jgi:hypothetical protein
VDVPILITIVLTVITVMVVLSRFLKGSYGQLRPNGEVGEAFAAFQVRELRYYTSGPDSCPRAIMGLDRTWDLQDVLWKRRELTAATMKELVTSMQQRHQPLHGFDIIDDRGRKIGEWLSTLDAQTTIKIGEDHSLWVSTPSPDRPEDGAVS